MRWDTQQQVAMLGPHVRFQDQHVLRSADLPNQVPITAEVVMSDTAAQDIVRTVRRMGRAKADVFEVLMAEGLVARGVPEERAEAAARECSNRIWHNGLVTGAAAVILVGATSANVPAVMAGGSAASLGGLYTMMLSDACRDVRQLSGHEVLSAVDKLLGSQ